MAHQRILSFRDLDVWQEAMALAVECYKLTASYPDSEKYGLISQTRRAAVSIPSNIAEGQVRPTNVYKNHVSIALGSQAELDTLMELADRLAFAGGPELADFKQRMHRVGRMLHKLGDSL